MRIPKFTISKSVPSKPAKKESAQPKEIRISQRKAVISVVIIIILALIPSVYFYNKNHKSQSQQDETTSLVKKISKHALLPTGEDPTVATVQDPSKLKGQAFFNDAQKDDKVLVYTKAGKAFLYRPSIDRLIVAAPLNSSSSGTSGQ